MVNRRPCPTCSVIATRWHPKYVLGVFNQRNRWRILVTLIFSILCTYFNSVVQVLIQKRAEVFNAMPVKYNMTLGDKTRVLTLPDVGFDIFPNLEKYGWVPDLIVGLSLVATMTRFIPTPLGPTIFRRWLFFMGVMFFLRAISISITMLPNPYPLCNVTADVNHPASSAFMVMIGQQGTCADVMFSGHTFNITICALLWHFYSHEPAALFIDTDKEWDIWEPCCRSEPVADRAHQLKHMTFIKVCVWTFAAIGYFMITASRFHYSVDVFIGFALTFMVFEFYHSHIHAMWDSRDSKINVVWVWLEKYAQDVDYQRDRSASARGRDGESDSDEEDPAAVASGGAEKEEEDAAAAAKEGGENDTELEEITMSVRDKGENAV